MATSGTKLNPPLVAGRTVTSFALTPDATAVIYIADQDLDDVFELYRVNLANPGFSTKLNPTFVVGSGKDVVEFAVTPDNTSVVYRADQDFDDVFELYRTVLATQVNSKLNPPYPQGSGQDVEAFVILPNSTGVIYRANQTTASVDLYRVLFATAPLFDTLTSLGPGKNVGDFAATPNSASVVYIANQVSITSNELFIVPAGGGGISQLNDVSSPPINPNRNVTSFAVTPDGFSVVYRADQNTDEVFELYRVIIATPGTSTKLNGPLANCVPGPGVCGDVTPSFGVIPDSSGVVYIAEQNTDDVFELFRTVFSGNVNTQLNPPFVGPEDVTDFVLFPNSAGVVYRADQNTDGINQIYRVVFGFPGSVRLDTALFTVGQNVLTYAVAPDSLSAIYRANQDDPAIIELYRTTFSSPNTSTKLNAPPLTVGKNVANFAVR
jgi:hypothetical protein